MHTLGCLDLDNLFNAMTENIFNAMTENSHPSIDSFGLSPFFGM